MNVNQYLTDYERVELTKKSYEKLQLGQKIVINRQVLGTVCRVIHAADGMTAYVITNPGETTILYKGSYGILKGNPQTWRDEWLKTNLPLLFALLANERRIPSQLRTAAKVLNETLKQYKNTRFYIYGHSLGSMNAQYALANCRQPKMIAAAYLYEGINIWPLLTQKERQRVAQMHEKIFNYVDLYDPVTLGKTATHHMVGKLCYVASKPISPVKQHLWGGYQFDQQGKLKLHSVDDRFLQQSLIEQKFLTKSGNLTSKFEHLSQAAELKKLFTDQVERISSRYPEYKNLEKLALTLKNELLKEEEKWKKI